jgi:hypothetical protein
MGCNFHGQLTVGCCQVFNNDRFKFNRSLIPHPVSVDCSTTCSVLVDDDPECVDPWLDVAYPETENIIGLYVTEMEVGNPFTRSTGEKFCGGFAKPLRPSTREMVFRGVGLAAGECAVELLKEWFIKNTVASGSCNGESASWFRCCDRSQIRYAEGFLWTGLTFDNTNVGVCHGFEFEITAEVLDPHLYGEQQVCLDDVLKDGDCPKLVLCEPACEETLPDQLCGCHSEIPVQTDTTVVDEDCFCPPVEVWRKCCTFEPYGNLNEWVLTASIQNGWLQESSYVRVRAWSDPNMMGSDKLIERCYKPCVDMVISCLPKGGGFVFDGKTNRTWVLDKYGRRSSGRRLLSAYSKMNHVFGCKPVTVCVESDANRSDPDLSATITFEPRFVS